MKIKDIIFKSQGNCITSLVLGMSCILMLIITLVCPEKYNTFTFCYPIEYPWQFLSGIFVHGTPEFPIAVSIGHLIFNLLLVFSFGILIEKIVGSKRFSAITLAVWLMQAVVFQLIARFITPNGECARGAGISGLAFMYGTVGMYILFRLFQMNKKLFFKQVSTCLYLNIVIAMLAMLNPFVAGIAAFIVHAFAVLAGIVTILLMHRTIDGNIAKLAVEGELVQGAFCVRFAWFIVPILLIVIAIVCK